MQRHRNNKGRWLNEKPLLQRLLEEKEIKMPRNEFIEGTKNKQKIVF